MTLLQSVPDRHERESCGYTSRQGGRAGSKRRLAVVLLVLALAAAGFPSAASADGHALIVSYNAQPPFSVDEGGTATFTVSISTQPTSDLTVTVDSSDAEIATVSPATLTFTSANWSTAQTVTVTGQHDSDKADEALSVALSTASTELEYEGLTQTLAVSVVDDDNALVLDPELEDVTVDEGATATFTVKFAAAPSDDTTVSVLSPDVGAATVSPASLTFTTEDWETAQTVTVTGEHDIDIDDETVFLVLTTSTSADPIEGITAHTLANVTDDDKNKSRFRGNPDLNINIANAPLDLWSDGTTVWVLTDVPGTPGIKVNAYELHSSDPDDEYQRQADSTKSFTPDGGTGTGLWSDGTTMWIAQDGYPDGGSIEAYVLADGTRDDSKDITLDSDNRDAKGLWSDGTTMWTADVADGKLYAYTLASGDRDADKDMELFEGHGSYDAGNAAPVGLWSNGTTMWVTDLDQRVYAYTLATGAFDESNHFFANLAPHSWSAATTAGLWGDGHSTVWIAGPNISQLVAFNLAGRHFGGL